MNISRPLLQWKVSPNSKYFCNSSKDLNGIGLGHLKGPTIGVLKEWAKVDRFMKNQSVAYSV